MSNFEGQRFPLTRLRRTRLSASLRRLVAETSLTASNLVYPVFVIGDDERTEAIASMPGIRRLGLGPLLEEAKLAVSLGIPAIALFLRHPREERTASQIAAAAAVLVLTPAIFWLLPADRAEALPAALYGLALGGMAACAWLSAFPRYRVGVGAALFLVSDLLLVAERGPLMGEPLVQWLVWPLYYLGQLLICLGVFQHLRRAGT